MRWRLSALMSAVLLLTACATQQDIQPTEHAEAGDRLGVKAPALRGATQGTAAWWEALGDARLNGLVTQALADGPSVRVAQARMLKAQAMAGYVRGGDRPQIQASAEVDRQRYSELGLFPPPLSGKPITVGTLQLEGSWELDLFGKQRAELDAAIGQSKAAEADLEAARLLLSNQVVRTYAQLARQIAQRDVLQRLLAQREQTLGLVKQRVQAGLDTAVELKQGEGALPDARLQLEAVREQIILTRHALATLVGQAPDALGDLSPDLSVLKISVVPAHVPVDLLSRRADVQAARWRVEASGYQTQAARALFYPNVDLVAFGGVNAIGLDRLFDGGGQQWGLMPAIHLPLFDGDRRRSNLQSKVADQDAAIASYNQSVLDAVREAADNLASVQAIERQQREQAQAQASAESAYDLALQRYRAGLGTYLTVLTSESAVLAQRRAAVDLKARAIDTQAALVRAMGGSISGDPS
ncbi:MAG: efflux transporter outer membrane subunit [Burkholderiales bacterium]|nr:efflux transporter outer membrane subunit [Burkholderiales bacterium]